MSRVPLKSVCAFSLIAVAITGCRSTQSLSKQDYRPEVNDDQFIAPAPPQPIVASTLVDTPSPEEVASDSDDSEDSANFHLVTAESGSDLPTTDQVVPVSLMTDEKQFQAAPVWSLSDLEAIALQQNPAIRQASASASKATGFRNQVGLKPNPVIGYQGTQLADKGTDQHAAFVEQEIVRGDKLRKNERVLNQEIQSQLWEVETQRVRVITDLRLRYYEALAAQKRLQLANEFEVVAQKGVEVAEARVSAKEGTRPEVLQAEIQLRQIQLAKRQSEAAFQGAWRQLMAVAGMPAESRGTLDGTLGTDSAELDWAAVEQRILSSSPEMQGARARFARARANMDRQQAQAVPNLTLMLAAGQDNSTGSGMINTQVGLPLPVHNKNQGNIAAAYAEYCRASQDVRRTELAIQSRLAAARQEFEMAAAAVSQSQSEILPRANESLELAEKAYQLGEFGFLQVLVARRTYFDANLEYVSSQLKLASATALIDGSVLSGGLDSTRDTEFDSGLRDQSLTGQ